MNKPQGLDLRWDTALRDLQIHLEPRVSRSEAAPSKAPREDGSRFRAELIAVNPGPTIQPQEKNENKKYDNSALKKINRPLAPAAP